MNGVANLCPHPGKMLEGGETDATAERKISVFVFSDIPLSARLDPVTSTTLPFMLGRSVTGLNDVEGALYDIVSVVCPFFTNFPSYKHQGRP